MGWKNSRNPFGYAETRNYYWHPTDPNLIHRTVNRKGSAPIVDGYVRIDRLVGDLRDSMVEGKKTFVRDHMGSDILYVVHGERAKA